MFCSHCGAELDIGDTFCYNCGETVDNVIDVKLKQETNQVLFNFDGTEYNIVDMVLTEKFKKDIQIFDWIASEHQTSRKTVLDALESQRYEIIRNYFQLKGWVDKEDKTIICGIPIITRLQNARKGAKELEPLYKEVIRKLGKVDMRAKVTVKEYIIRLANEYKIKGTHDGPMMCLRCGGTNIEAYKKGFSGKKAVIGAIALGPMGVVAGGIGSDKLTYHCLDCGFNSDSLMMFKVAGC